MKMNEKIERLPIHKLASTDFAERLFLIWCCFSDVLSFRCSVWTQDNCPELLVSEVGAWGAGHGGRGVDHGAS